MRQRLACVAVCASILLLAVACAESPRQRTEKLRARYQAAVTGLVVKEEPLTPPAAEPASEETSAAVAPAAAGEGATEEVAAAAAEPVPVRQLVTLDLLVRHDAKEKLSQLTVEIVHLAQDGQREKGRYRRTLDVSGVERGPGTQVTLVLEDIGYEPNDGFAVEVRSPVPAGEEADYPELAGT